MVPSSRSSGRSPAGSAFRQGCQKLSARFRCAARVGLIAQWLGVDQGLGAEPHSKLTTGLLNPSSDCIHGIGAEFISESEHPYSVERSASDHPVHRNVSFSTQQRLIGRGVLLDMFQQTFVIDAQYKT